MELSTAGVVAALAKCTQREQRERTTAVESLTVCSQMKGASGTSMTTVESESVDEVSVSISGLSKSSRPPGAILDLDGWGQRARSSFSVSLARELKLSLLSSPSSMPAKKLLLVCVTASLMGFIKEDESGEMLVSSELHSESTRGICFLWRKERQWSPSKEATSAQTEEALSLP